LHAIERFGTRVTQVIDNHHLMARIEQFHEAMRADITCATRNENRLLFCPQKAAQSKKAA
jgi:hypothetical protein